MRSVVGWFLVAAVCVSLCSCGSRERARKKTYAVTGKVTVDGSAEAYVKVVANAKEAGDPNYPVLPQAVTKEDGTFQLYSYQPGDGAPPGEYTLTFTWQEPQGLRYGGPDKLKNRYSNPAKSTFPLKIEKSKVDLGTIELTTK